jgi:hypothetical protein
MTDQAKEAEPHSGLPAWLPEAARHYLHHTADGQPIRALARQAQVHASTVLRQVRRLEALRDDPLIDEALRLLSAQGRTGSLPATEMLETEAARVLRRLVEPGAVLAVAREMETAVIVRDDGQGGTQRIGTVARSVAQAMALSDWMASDDPQARVIRYRITAAGRNELRRLTTTGSRRGMDEAPTRFRGAAEEDDHEGDDRIRHMRSILGESPLATLARRRDREGAVFLSRELVAAGERLREDFEIAQAGSRTTQDWARFLTGPIDLGHPSRDQGSSAAADRLARALADLGPGLGDVALRFCCQLEGLESIESRMGWAARSGKIVLRIALQRLARHYAQTLGQFGPMIG